MGGWPARVIRRADVRRGALALLTLVLALGLLDRVFPPPLERAEVVSHWVSDREGRPLRAFPTPDGRWRFQADLADIDPVFLEALLEVEDRRFHSHGGVDWVAMVRAAVTSARAGRIVSGGSTITMQTARLLEPRPRTLASKIIEMVRAHQIEARLSKEEILELYLTLAPYGGNLEGVRAASWRYFGHGPDKLSDDEIALLIALPQSPERRRPDRQPGGAEAGRAAIVTKLRAMGVLSERRATEARDARLPAGRHDFPSLAWHASAQALAQATPSPDIRTTLDGPLQAELEGLVRARAALLEPDVQIAVLVVDVPTRAVRAAIGSAGRNRAGGWLDLTDSPSRGRSPGSPLKPFIYAAAFDDGIAGPATVISDLPKRFAAYQPENFDRSFRGDVTIAEALQHSLNVPAVLALAEVGPQRFAADLALAGAPPRLPDRAGADAGLALALGGAGLTARDLAILYAALGDGGRALPLEWVQGPRGEARGHRLMSPASAAHIIDILAATPTPSGRMPSRLTENAPDIAFKTGTSYGFRDAWAAGLSGDLAIIVWVGRADGAPRPGETGRKAALPLLFEIADRATHHLDAGDTRVSRLASSDLPEARAAHRRFTAPTRPEILFPPQDAELWAGDLGGRAARAFVLTGRGAGRLTWYVDGEPAETDAAGLALWRPVRAGFYRVSAVDENGVGASVEVRVIGLPPGQGASARVSLAKQ